MPRIITSCGYEVDFCNKDLPRTAGNAKLTFSKMGNGPDGSDQFAYRAPHPSYRTFEVKCDTCHAELTEVDN
jgi:hypothetical protein